MLIMKKLNSYRWGIVGALVGAIGGYVYWQQIGCVTGTCPIKSNWQTMVPYSMVLGYLGGDLLKPIFERYASKQ
jgi:hypothetical protein